MTRLDLLLSACALAIVCGLAPASRARACCPAAPPETTVQIAEQEILVAWNPETKLEHFVRRASFAAQVPGFGFLVPTPTRPTLSEVETAVFDRLRVEIEPRVVVVERTRLNPGFLCMATLGAGGERGYPLGMAMDERVHVLEQTRVAGYDAAVLQADDAQALARWLEDNGYDARPALREWIAPYVAARWVVTAFKFSASAGEVATGSVRMSFQTDRPLFPYRTPTDQRGGGNTLRVFYVGQGRASGTLGEGRKPWPAEVKYASPSPEQGFARLLGQAIPAADVPAGAWLTAIEDPTWPGGEEDLFFSADPQGAELIPTITIHRDRELYVPLEPVVLLLVGVGVWRWRAGRARAGAGKPAPRG